MFAYPYLAHYLFAKQPGAAGLFLGTAIHDTSQVMAAALSYNQVFGDEVAMKVATMTKLTRNVFLVGVVPLLAFTAARQQGTERKRVNIGKLFPLFVLGFAAMAIFRSLGDAGLGGRSALAFGLWNSETWKHVTKALGETIAYGALGAAMASVGLTTNLSTFKVLGLKPLYVGAMSATLVGVVALGLAALVGPRIDAHMSQHPGAAPSAPAPRRPQDPTPGAVPEMATAPAQGEVPEPAAPAPAAAASKDRPETDVSPEAAAPAGGTAPDTAPRVEAGKDGKDGKNDKIGKGKSARLRKLAKKRARARARHHRTHAPIC